MVAPPSGDSTATQAHPLVRAANAAATGFVDRWPTLLFLTGTIYVAAPELAGANGDVLGLPKAVLFGAGALALLIGTIAAETRIHQRSEMEKALARREGEAVSLRAENECLKEAPRSFCRLSLELLARDLDYWSNERISLFRRRRDQGGFELIGRYSARHDFRSHTREVYPEEGCLGEAWQNGWACESGLPLLTPSDDAWIDAQKRNWKIPPATARQMTMKSRTYVAIRIAGGTGLDASGVIVFESLDCLGDDNLVEASKARVPVLEVLQAKVEEPSTLAHLRGLLNVAESLAAPALPDNGSVR